MITPVEAGCCISLMNACASSGQAGMICMQLRPIPDPGNTVRSTLVYSGPHLDGSSVANVVVPGQPPCQAFPPAVRRQQRKWQLKRPAPPAGMGQLRPCIMCVSRPQSRRHTCAHAVVHINSHDHAKPEDIALCGGFLAAENLRRLGGKEGAQCRERLLICSM